MLAEQTFWDFLSSGGPIMVPIALCSILVIAFAVERFLGLRPARVCPRSVDEAAGRVNDGALDEALSICTRTEAPAGRILAAGLRRGGHPLADVERAMEDQGLKELDRMRGNIRPLAVIANVTPLLGLFGTVVGIQRAFHQVVASGLGKPENLAQGIEMALVTTVAGLFVAIPALILAAWLTARARQRVAEMDEKLAGLVEVIAGPSDAA